MTKLASLGTLLVLIVSTVHAQTIRQIPITAVSPLSSELSIPVEEPPVIPAPGSQREVAIASSGESALAVWADRRYDQYDIFASRLDSDGNPLDPMGIPVAPTYADDVGPDVVWTGSHYFVVWHSFLGVSHATVSAEGVVTGSSFVKIAYPILVSASAVGWNGDRILVIWTQRGLDTAPDDPLRRVFGVFLDESGEPITDPFIVREAELDARIVEPEVASDGNGFVATWEEGMGGRRRVVAAAIDSAGRVADPVVLGEAPDAGLPCASTQCGAFPDITPGDGEYLVVWSDDRVQAQRVDGAGQPIGERVTVSNESSKSVMPTAVRNAQGWTCWWSQTPEAAAAWNPVTRSLDVGELDLYSGDLDNDLRIEEVAKLVSNAGAQIDPDVALVSGSALGIWTDFRNAPDSSYVPACCSWGDLFAAAEDQPGSANGHLVACAEGNQQQTAVATLDETILTVWLSQLDDDEYELKFRLFDRSGGPRGMSQVVPGSRGHFLRNPAVTSSNERFLIAWTEGASRSSEVRALRIQPDGVFDPEPIVVGRGTNPDLASDGSAFLIAADREALPPLAFDQYRSEVFAAIVTSVGQVLQAQVISEPSAGGIEPKVVWTGEHYLVVWSQPVYGSYTSVFGRFLSATASPLGEESFVVAESKKYRPPAVDVSSNGSVHLVTSGVGLSTDARVSGFLVSDEGSVSPDPHTFGLLVPGSYSGWDGKAFVLSFDRLDVIEPGRVVLTFTESIAAVPSAHDQGITRAFLQIVSFGGRERSVRGVR